MMRSRTYLSAAAMLLGILGCGSPAAAPSASAADALRDYPGTLHPAAELKPDFAVEQSVRIVYRGQKGSFDAVLQKQGDSLLVLGVGPMNVRTFQLEQRGVAVSFEQKFGPALPFPPRNILIDIHRAFFMKVEGAAPLPNGAIEEVRDGERITERWEAGNLRERAFFRPGYKGAVRVSYTGPCSRAFCNASKIVLQNEWFGYELTIESRDYSLLP